MAKTPAKPEQAGADQGTETAPDPSKVADATAAAAAGRGKKARAEAETRQFTVQTDILHNGATFGRGDHIDLTETEHDGLYPIGAVAEPWIEGGAEH